MSAAGQQWCREQDEHGDRCADRAEFLLWGKLFPPEALGPRCHTHAVRHTHWGMPSRTDQWAVLDLRHLTDRTDLAAAQARLAAIRALCLTATTGLASLAHDSISARAVLAVIDREGEG